MSRAVCVRCGGDKADYRQVCPSCGNRPAGEGLLVSWLCSLENLEPADLDRLSARIREGESIRPSGKSLEKARKALGLHLASDPGLSSRERLGYLAMALLLTPLPGWVAFWWWRETRPRASLQVLGLTLPSTVLFTVVVVWGLVS